MLCVVVGAGPGLGRAIADRFLAEGMLAGLVCRRPERLADWQRTHGARGRIRLVAADAADPTSLGVALDELTSWGGPCQVLVYNAADLTPGDVEALDVDTLLASMRTNVGGALLSVRHVVPAMRAAGSGTILVTGGGLALEPYPEWAALAAGKAALRSVALNLHKALLADGLHVATVAVCGVVAPGTAFDPDDVAEHYWRLHREPLDAASREVVLLPEGEDPFYNDPAGRHRATSRPIVPTPPRREDHVPDGCGGTAPARPDITGDAAD